MDNSNQSSSNFSFFDITKELEILTSTMKPDEMLQDPQFSLYDSMSATELCDIKMDWKCKLDECDTLDQCIDKKTLKDPIDLLPEELIYIFDELLSKEMLWFKGNSLAQTIYTFIYLYDNTLYQKNIFLKSYIESIHFGGFTCYELIRHSNYLRDDDYVPSVVSFLKLDNFDEKQIISSLLEAEHQLSDKITNMKKQKKQKEIQYNIFDALDARIKFRRGLFTIYMLLKQRFSSKNADEIINDIQNCRKKLEIIKKTVSMGKSINAFSEFINKTLLCHIPPRPHKILTNEETFQDYENMFNQFEFIINLSKKSNFYEILSDVEDFIKFPKNILCHAFLDISLYCVPEKFFGEQDFKEIMINVFKEFGLNVKAYISNKIFQDYIAKTVLVGLEYIAKNIRNKFRQQRDYSKLYQDLSILIHESNSTDEVLFTSKKETNLSLIWCYDLSMKMMIKQLLLGFELELYIECDYPYILFYLDYMCGALENNKRNYISKYDKEFLLAWQTKINFDKKKKKITEFERRFFFESLYYKGLQFFFKALSRFSYLLFENNFIDKFNENESYEARFYNRLRIFEKCYFLKKLDYESYTKIMNEFKNENELPKLIEKLKDLFTEAQKLFSSLVSEDSFVNNNMKKDCDKLKRLCILNTVAMNKFIKFQENNSKVKAIFKNSEHPIYHYIDFI